MHKLSVVILTKNEEEDIGRAIKSVKDIADEIIVLDSGSKDRTVEIAKELGAKVFFREFDNFSNQRNYSLTLPKMPWILVLDADEELSEELKQSIKRELRNPRYDCYLLNRRTYFLGKFLNHTLYPEWRLRLFRKGKAKYEGELHEVVRCFGKIGKLKGDLYHYSFKDFKDFLMKNIRYSEISAKALHKKGKRASSRDIIIRPVWTFIKFFFLKKGFLDGWRGFTISLSYAFFNLAKYVFLKELSRDKELK
ncbi:glycosyltransferase family 2 protein [Aquifex sp.]